MGFSPSHLSLLGTFALLIIPFVPPKSYNRTFSINSFKNCESIWTCFRNKNYNVLSISRLKPHPIWFSSHEEIGICVVDRISNILDTIIDMSVAIIFHQNCAKIAVKSNCRNRANVWTVRGSEWEWQGLTHVVSIWANRSALMRQYKNSYSHWLSSYWGEGQWRTWHSASGGGGGASEGAKGPSPNERSERGGGGGGAGSLSHGRGLFDFDACDRTISCIPLVYFVDLESLHNSEKIVLLKE